MPFNRQIPDAPIAMSMLPQLDQIKSGDLLLVTRPSNPLGQRNKVVPAEKLPTSDLFKFSNPVIYSGLLELNNLSLPATNTGNFQEVAHVDIDPRLDVEFHVWGTSGQAYKSSGSDQTRFDYGLRAKVRQYYAPDDQDRDLVAACAAGFRFEDPNGNAYGPGTPTYNTIFGSAPYNYNPSVGELGHHPTKRVTLYLSSGSSASHYQCHEPDSYSLTIQARIFPCKIASQILVGA